MKTLTVQELIDFLSKVENKNQDIFFCWNGGFKPIKTVEKVYNGEKQVGVTL